MAGFSSGFVGKVVFPLWASRDHPHYRRYIAEFERTQFSCAEELRRLRLQRLRDVLVHASRKCPFYAAAIRKAGLEPSALTSVAQINLLPIVTKKDIQDRGAEMMARDFPPHDRLRNQTGGSTGSPLQFYVDRERFDSRLASTVRCNRWAGIEPGDWTAKLWGARLDQVTGEGLWNWCRNTFLYRQVELNTSCIREEDWSKFIAMLRSKRPRFLVSYAQSAVLFAKYLRERGIEDIFFDSIVTTAEVLLPGQRELLESVFKGRVFDRYGCREVSVIACECELHNGMHVNAESLLVEVVPVPGLPEGFGKVIVTDLLNRSMPLIRYEIGDLGRWAENQNCACGRELPLLAEVQGRTTDFLTLQDGRRISGPALTLVISDMAEVRQVQFVQHEVTSVTLRVVPGENYGSQTATELRRRLNPYLDSATTLFIEETERIASEASGKYRFCINTVPTTQELRGKAETRSNALA